jgi:hypothetical protein
MATKADTLAHSSRRNILEFLTLSVPFKKAVTLVGLFPRVVNVSQLAGFLSKFFLHYFDSSLEEQYSIVLS